MRDRSFIPFYLKPNKQRITREEPPIQFPNYMNRQSQRPKRELKNLHLFKATHQIPKQISSHRRNHPALWDKNASSNNYKNSASVQMTEPQMAPNFPESNQKEAYYQQIRQELDEMKFYQSRRPFKPTEVPTIWKSGSERSNGEKISLSSAADNSSKYSPESTGEINKQVANFKETGHKTVIKGESLQRHKKNHLNRGLATIMDQERSLSVAHGFIRSNKTSNYRQKNQTCHAPLLDRQQTNGDKT